ncbi:Metallo-hydrolase/oxidoreductase [Amniculicola lignicola CBS 123094]|uniref:Metallo-hydrolase/oxidoreductase n=1 Tax=Amniculicola lignicola CBS 123094 TaxID=1392246 RepID=A0A6A5WTG6_9PLEO|nr:Metallo-hydrolase/oxidoreductase [Amniculicola lignicola CBS 123094]
MQSVQHLIAAGHSTKAILRSTSLKTTQGSVSGVYNRHSRAFHQHIQGRTSTSFCTIAQFPSTTLNSQRGISKRSAPTATISTQASFSTQTIIPQEPTIHSVYETKTGTWQYVVVDPSTKKAVVIDAVLDYDPATQVISTEAADGLLSLISEKGYKIEKILETHAHADHLTAASYLQKQIEQQQGYKPPICAGKRITQVQDLFGAKYGVPAQEYRGVFDKLFDDEERFEIGNLTATATHLPGHTPDHLGYIVGENVFCGDSIFHTDIGTARADFPGGSATSLYESGRKLLRLPEHFKIWPGHDYPSEDRAPIASVSVKEHKEHNKHLANDTTQQEFVLMREERDSGLAAPKLLHPSLQFNIRAGQLPSPTPAGQRFLRLPLKLKPSEW